MEPYSFRQGPKEDWLSTCEVEAGFSSVITLGQGVGSLIGIRHHSGGGVLLPSNGWDLRAGKLLANLLCFHCRGLGRGGIAIID